MYELVTLRDAKMKREIKIVNILTFIQSTMWKVLFGKTADSLEKDTSDEDKCHPPPFCAPNPTDMISDKDPLVNRFISIPRDLQGLNCAAYIAGIVRGILDAADFVRP
jgi:trafficking protein particle complex subunit 5